MQRTTFLLAYIFFLIAIWSINCFSQPTDPVAIGSRGQYPFVQYTPKDGLISNSIRGIYQDSKGRLYFTSINGLSVYDGARFTNYNSKNGIENDIVNCVMEMGDDSIWVVTNAGRIHCLVNGKLKTVVFNESPPLIDNLIRDENGGLYAASEFGLYLFRQNKFIKLPLIDISGKNINTHISNIYPAGKHLLVVRENSLLNPDEKHIMYLYDLEAGKIVAQTQNEKIFYVAKAPDGRIWLSTIKNILSVDTIELKKGKIVLRELQPPFDRIEKNSIAFISFDQYGNCWMSDKVFALKKLSPDGSFISFSTTSGLSSLDISHVFQDKEGTTWIATFKAGVNKLVHSNFTFFSNAFGISSINSIVYATDKNQLYLYSPNEGKAIAIGKDNRIQSFEVDKANKFLQLHVTPKGMFGFSETNIFKISRSGNKLYSEPFNIDTIENVAGNPLVDRNGNLVFWGNFITAIIDGKILYLKKNNYSVDNASLDTIGNIWITTRNGELIMYQPQADDPSRYLEKEIIVSKKLPDISPRSIIIDSNNNIWIGSRSDGIHVFKLNNANLIRQFYVNSEMGLSDNFITWLDVDMDNNIWACSPSGLDKISIKNGVPVIENITKQNNIYQSATKVVIDKNNTVWALLSNGLIKITPENKQFTGFSPTLMVSMIKSGKDTITQKAAGSLMYTQNNLSFYFAATSFLDEKQIQYSYKLQGSGNDQWSDPSNNSTISFIDLRPGDYTLDIKANFPADRYPEQIINHKFSIAPPWWQTWWFRTVTGILIIGLLIIGSRFYYRRKLEKQMAVLEKKQAIQKERTRIATDMHDDLGAGLSRIKFLSETIGIKQQQQQTVEEEISSIRNYSHEMIDKMGEIVWALNEKNDTLSDLLAYTRSYAVEYLSQNGIKCIIETPEQFPQTFVSGEFRRNIYLTVKEALHNIVKHAQASEVTMKISLDENLNIRIKDDGTGFNRSAIRPFSNGLTNMESRIKEAGGRFEIISDAGTDIRIMVPLPA